MGKMNTDQTQTQTQTPNETTINHFSHPHPLKLCNYQPQQTPNSSCSGCKLNVSGFTYSCTVCNYFLHKKCSEMPQKITHPFHKDHVFSLLPKPTYPNGLFRCDACGEDGDGFSYHCKPCNVDLHILCAVMPLSLSHASHPHKLSLAFECPYPLKSFCCDICRNQGGNHWVYRCSLCGFDAHLNCAKGIQYPSPQMGFLQQNSTNFTSFQSQTPIPQVQTQFSVPGSMSQQQNPTNFTSFQSQTPIPQVQTQFSVPGSLSQPQGFGFGFGTQFMARPPVQPNPFAPATNDTAYGIPAGPALPSYGNREYTDIYLQAIQQIYSNSLQANQNFLQAMMGAGGGGGGRETQQMLQMLAAMNNGGGGSVPGLDAFSGGGIPNVDAFGGSAGGQNFLQELMNGGGGGGGLDFLQSLLGGGNGLDILGGLGGALGGF